ncbi:FAD-dependent oxidoreductase [Novosphingobium colocasiae]|uniref:Glutamate synthase n=1 Tax=Novosphingobium colocasiae TaxID=1256513 RepID=A0A918PH84_9SPHN|nr:NAD(P)/FAD-dependent oxidoreductase [Novosphingobium colocasiae]GGZ07976.1 glutamate synthase [Novosphingobium colocasiae]
MTARDIAIAGCGPAGLAAALLLHRGGHRIEIFERFDTPRPIGSGLMLQPTGLAVLDRLGLAETILARGARIDRLLGKTAGGHRTVLDVHYSALRKANAFGIGIHRAALFGTLYDAVLAAGIPIRTGRTISGSRFVGERRQLEFDDGERGQEFDLLVDALGTRTPLAPPTGRMLDYGALWASLTLPRETDFQPHALEQRYHRASRMVGVLPIGSAPSTGEPQVAFFWSLRADQFAAWQASGLQAWKREVLDLWPACAPLLDQIVDPDQLVFARYAHRTLRAPAEPGLIHIGDAWHSASPQLGQGANMALLDAWALARGLRDAPDIPAALARTVDQRRRHVGTYQALTALFTPVYQSDSRILPLVRDRLVGPLSQVWPATWIQAAMVAGLIGDPLTPLGLN